MIDKPARDKDWDRRMTRDGEEKILKPRKGDVLHPLTDKLGYVQPGFESSAGGSNLFTIGDAFQVARNCPGMPARYVHANSVLPLPTTTVTLSFTLKEAAVFKRNGNDKPDIFDRAPITMDYLFLMYCPVAMLVQTPEQWSGFVAIQTDTLDVD